ncbi:protein-disulfide reductase DsbD N-terminal domain-containing protein, partial [Mariniblastus sp.]|nr:protein-disulfide reductase DsbD N-terminal domain-containing protein [Mariniblastus sp.]
MKTFALIETMTPQTHFARILSLTLFITILFASSASAQTSLVESDFQVKTDTQTGVLALKFAVPEGWHCFSTTQLPGGPLKSKITVAGKGVKVTGEFAPTEAPVDHDVEGFDVVCEQHEGVVTWKAPIEFEAGVDPAKVELEVKYKGQICMNEPPGACKQVNEKVTPSFSGFVKDLGGKATDKKTT